MTGELEKRLLHEQVHRSTELMERLALARVTLCGAGAVGSNLAATLARQGFGTLTVIDDDRVEQQNLSTQTYHRADVGAQKVIALRNEIFRAVGVEIDAVPQRLTERNVSRLLKDSDVVIDGFDNAESRALVQSWARENGRPCLHVGLAGDYAEVIWTDAYRVPSAAGQDICEYPLARNLILLAVSVAAECLVDFLAGNPPASFTLTLRDLRISSYP